MQEENQVNPKVPRLPEEVLVLSSVKQT